MKACLSDLNSSYVFAPAHKARSNITIICKRYHIMTLIKELGLDNCSIPTGNSAYTLCQMSSEDIVNIHDLDKLIKKATESLRESSIYHTVILMTLSVSITTTLRNLFLIFTPKKLTISGTRESTSVASYRDLLFTRDRSNNLKTKLYDKRDAFGFHIVNFPFMSSNIPSAPAYGVYASQIIRYAHCCSNYSNFL